MKRFSFIIALNILSICVFAEVKKDSVFSESEVILKTSTGEIYGTSNKILDSLKIGKTVSNVNPNLVSLYRPSVQPYMISWIKYDPTKEIGKLKIPVLIIQGTTDLQVTVDDSKSLSAANTNAKLLIIENMNHTLKESDSDIQKNMATYNNPDLPLKEGLTDDIVNFINSTKLMES